MKTAYKPYVKSPFQVESKKMPVVQERHPAISQEIVKNIGEISFTATFKEDTETLGMFKNSNVVAFVCELKIGSQVVGFGRGFSALSTMNKYVERTVRSAYNSSLISAIVQASKMIDILNTTGYKRSAEIPSGGAYNPQAEKTPTPITEKQKSYLLELVQQNVSDEDEIIHWKTEINSMTKNEASQQIEKFLAESDNNY